MSQLSDKILSYSPEQYFTNEEPFSNTNLKNYGSKINTIAWTQTGTAPTFNSTGGPSGGSGCWKFSTNYNSEQALRSFGNSGTAAAPYSVTVDGNYSAGGWFRIPTQVQTGNTESNFDILRFGGGTSGSSVRLYTTGANIGKVDFNNPTFVNPVRLDDGNWHYYAERMSFDGTTYTKERYLDGVFVNTATVTTAQTIWYLAMGDNFINSVSTTPDFVEIAHVYIAPLSSIDATAISEIYQAGINSPSTRTVKYFNGTSWVDSIGQKVWNGTAWVDWNAKRFDGSTWVNV